VNSSAIRAAKDAIPARRFYEHHGAKFRAEKLKNRGDVAHCSGVPTDHVCRSAGVILASSRAATSFRIAAERATARYSQLYADPSKVDPSLLFFTAYRHCKVRPPGTLHHT
jgi:hypothetical protein